MAHQSHALPWRALASYFTYAEAPPKFGYRTNFVTDLSDARKKEIEYFGRAFERCVRERSSLLRSQYPSDLQPPEANENILSDDALFRFRRSLHYCREHDTGSSCRCCYPFHFSNEDTCVCNEVFEDINCFGSWLSFFTCDACRLRIGYKGIVDHVKIMLMHDEIEPLLRAASHPRVKLDILFDFPFDNGGHHGWSMLLDAALGAYLVLNIIYLKPTTWPAFSQSKNSDTVPDYRRTAVYQRMLTICTATRHFDGHTLPHRLFYGIPRDLLSVETSRGTKPLVGLFPLRNQFRKQDRDRHLPSKVDVESIVLILRRKRLPREIIDMILASADYAPSSRLEIPDDPFHPDNEVELKKYLSYCWKLIVHCDALMEECGYQFDWIGEVKDRIIQLFCAYPEYPRIDYSCAHERPYSAEPEERSKWIRIFAW